MLRYILITCLSLLLFCGKDTFANNSFSKRKDVQDFIQQMVKKHKFSKEKLTSLFAQVKVRPQVMRHINKPLEKEAWHLYQVLFVNEWRIQHGVEFWNKYEKALADAEAQYGVPASIIVATIGIETKYGQNTGNYRVIDALSNIAFSDSTRAPFFKRELEQFLLLTREEGIDPLKLRGSYAGAIGQPQFMPSSYRAYAVDFSKNGEIDLMNDEVDVIGSIANYYRKHGWTTNGMVATRATKVGDRFNYLFKKGKIKSTMTLSEFSRYGIQPKELRGHDKMEAKLVELEDRYNNQYWLGFHNFYVIKRYNASDLYAMAVFQLSNYIEALRTRLNHGTTHH